MRRLWFLLILLLASPAAAQNVNLNCLTGTSNPFWLPASSTNPCPVTGLIGNQTGTTTQAKVTIAVTNTYQQALASSTTRKGCTIQYVAVAGTKGYVFFGSAPADTTTSFQLTNGQAINCQTPGVTLTDAVQLTGTGTDIFVVTNQ